MAQYILHVDLDAFFASVEQLDNPQYKGKPIIVGGLPHERRGVVSTCSYEARQFGVHSAMPTAKAYQLCPQGIFLHGRMSRYHEMSKKVMSIFYDFSPDVRQMSIDEAFIDISGTEMLFGSPEETAKLIQDSVLKQTGLTVSIGLASNHYVAKIASGYKKPHGLCFVPLGKETDFMLSLPLSKLWGAGTKTQEKLKTFGLCTIKQIYDTPLNNLITLFGTCTGNFLYNAVRGNEVESFTEPTKSRSISTEETFIFDLQDIFTIETALLRLCYDVQFRMLDEGFISRTVHLKIRYEDFSTVSIQSTYQRYISSVDDLFEKVKILFTQKNTQNKGIRLLGVGMQNLEKGTSPAQTELFDFGDEKKQKLEKAVLEIHKKNPKSKVIKARQVIKNLVVVLCFLFVLRQPIFADNAREEQTIVDNDRLPHSARNDDASDNDLLKKEISGYYEANIKTNIELINSQGEFELAFKPLVFSQKVGLSVWLEYNNAWSLEANTEDGFSNNTLLLSYINKTDEGFLKEFKIGNTNIYFPLDYGINQIGKGFTNASNLSFGTVLHFNKIFKNDKNLNVDFATKIDVAKTESKTWIGKNEQSNNQINFSDFVKKQKFYLLPNVNFADFYFYDSGNWKKLSQNELLLQKNRNELVINKSKINKIAAIIENKDECKIQLESFIESAKNWFTPNVSEDDFYKFLGLKNEATLNTEQFFTKIDGKDALLLLNEPFFSIFSFCNTYNLEKNATVHNSIEDFSVFVDEKNAQFTVKNNKDNSKIAELFPFAKDFPYLYLLPNSKNYANSTEMFFSTVSQSKSDNYTIGSDVIANTITVYKNGTSVPFNYNAKDSSVELLQPVSDFDTITVTWNTNGKNATTPYFSTAVGLSYDWSKKFNTNLSAFTSIPVNFDKSFATSKTPKSLKSTVALSANYQNKTEKSDFSFSNILATTVDLPNYTNKYLFLELDSHGTNPLYFENQKINTQTNLQKTNASSIQTKQGDFEFNFTLENATNKNDYFVATFDAPKRAILLQNANTFSILLKNANSTKIAEHYKVFLQIGDFASIQTEDFLHPENDIYNATWNITNQLKDDTNDFQKVTLLLDQFSKAKLGDCSKVRIIFVKQTNETENDSINVTLKGMEDSIYGSEFDSSQFLTAIDTDFIQDFGKIPFYTLTENKELTQFSFLNKSTSETKRTETATKAISPFPLAYYSELSFKVFIPDTFYSNFSDTTIEFLLLQTNANSEKECVSYKIDAKTLKSGKWNTIRIPISSKETVNKVKFVFTNENYTPVTGELFEELPSIYFGDFFTTGAFIDFGVSNTAEASFNLKKMLFLSDIKTHALNKTTTTFNNQFFLKNDLTTDLSFSTPLLIFNQYLDTSFNQAELSLTRRNSINVYESEISTNSDFLPFKYVTVKDSFFYDNESQKKGNALNFSLEPLKIKLNLNNSILVGKNKTDYSREINHALQFTNDFYKLAIIAKGTEKSKCQNDDLTLSFTYPYFLYFFEPDNTLNTRNYELLASQSFRFNNATPELEVSLKNQYSPKAINKVESTVGYKIEIPFVINKIKFVASYNDKIIAKSPVQQNKDNWYFGDFADFSNINDFLPNFYLLGDNIQSRIKNNVLFDFFEKDNELKITSNKSIFATNWDILVPTSLSFSIGSNKKATESSLNKALKYNFSSTNTAFNLFGKNAAKPVFSFFEQDEFINILNISYSNNALNFKNESEYNIYFNLSNRLKNTLIFDYSSGLTVYLRSFWQRPGVSTPLSLIVRLFPNSLKSLLLIKDDATTGEDALQMADDLPHFSTAKISRKDGVTAAISSKKQQIGFEHSVNYKASEHFELFSELSALLSIQKENFSTNFGVSFGGKLLF